MAKYRIKVEALDGDETLNMEYAEGIEADAFCIMADMEGKATVAMHKINIDNMATIMMHSSELLAAGVLAKAKKDIVDIGQKRDTDKIVRSLLGMED